MLPPERGEWAAGGYLQGELLGQAAVAPEPGGAQVHWGFQQPGQFIAGTHRHTQTLWIYSRSIVSYFLIYLNSITSTLHNTKSF